MTATRSRKEVKTYSKYLAIKTKTCPFCEIDNKSDQFVEETTHFQVLDNIFGYSLWDSQEVEDHLMIVPKQHINSLAKLPKTAAAEYVALLAKYEQKAYSQYSRAPSSVIKSVVHQHTHLIKPKGGPKRFVLLLRSPFYLRLFK